MLPQHTILTMDRNEVLGLHQGVHQLQFFLTGVTGNVHLCQCLIHHLCAAAVQLVDYPGNELFIARNRRCGNQHHVTLANLQLPVLGIGHAGQTCHRLALAAGGHDQDFFIRILIQTIHVNQAVFRYMQFANLHGDTAYVHHAAANEAYPSAIADAVVNHHLHAVNVAGKHGHNDPPLGIPEQILKGGADLHFAHGLTGTLHVGGFTQQCHNALLTQRRQGLQVRNLTVNGGVVYLEVAADHHRACRAGQCNGACPGNGVAYMDELAGKLAQLNFIPRLHHMHGDVGHPVLLHLQIHQGQGQLGAVQRCRYLPKDVRRCADVILMAVGKQVTPNVLLLRYQVADIRDHQVNAQHIFLWENAAAVHHHNVVFILEDCHVLTNFIHTAQ